MRFSNLLSVLMLVVTLSPGAAFAGDWYAAADLGQAHYGDLSNQVSTLGGFSSVTQLAETSSPDASAYRLSGGFRFNRYWGLEASYADLGQGELNGSGVVSIPCGLRSCLEDITFDFKFKAKALALTGLGTLPLDDSWSLFARLGMFHYQATEDESSTSQIVVPSVQNVVTGGFENTASGWKATWGIGVNYALSTSWTFRLGLDAYDNIGDNTTTQGNVRLLSIGAVHTF